MQAPSAGGRATPPGSSHDFERFDEKILALYARGIYEAHLEEIYGVKVGCDLISKVTDAVMDDARARQTRALEDVYPVVFLDALVRGSGATLPRWPLLLSQPAATPQRCC